MELVSDPRANPRIAATRPTRIAPWRIALGLGALLAIVPPSLAQFADAWNDYAANPDADPNIPNVSHAGYAGGGVSLPDGSGTVLIAVTNHGATGDGVTDDTTAVRDAIAEAASRTGEQPNGATVFFPPGTYRLSGPLLIHDDKIILRGFGTDQTTLLFDESLTSGYAVYPGNDPGDSVWSYAGGLIWFTDDTRNPYFAGVPTISDHGDGFRLSSTKNITVGASLGDRVITVQSTSGISPGDVIVVEVDNHSDESTLRHLFGDGTWANNYTFDTCCDADIMPANRSSFRAYHTVESVNGNQLTLREPLRFDCRTAWDPEVRIPGDLRRNVGIADMTVQMERDYEWVRSDHHNKEVGWNGVAFSDTIDGFLDNVRFLDVDGLAVCLSYAKNVTVSDVTVDSTGPTRHRHHHSFFIANSADCLVRNFTVNSRPLHGLHVGAFCVNNVYSNGLVNDGAFDYHKLLPYANVFTQIDIINSGDHGGGSDSGPNMGARHTHWNITTNRTSSRLIAQPDVMPKGALVGVRCAYPAQPLHPEAGDPECLIENVGPHASTPNPPNLYDAQLALRLGQSIPTAPPVAECADCVDDTAYAFDFGGTTGVALIGQDGWEFGRDFTLTDGQNVLLQIEPGHPEGPVLAAVSQNNYDSVITRQNDGAFAYTPHAHDDVAARVRFDCRAGTNGGPSGNAYLILNNAEGLSEGVQFGMNSSSFLIRGGRFGSALNESVSIPSGWYSRGEWARLELRINFPFNSGEGEASLFFMNLSDGDTEFTAVPGMQSVPFAGEVAYPETWDRIEFRIRNDAAATNIIANVDALAQCCAADMDASGGFTATDVMLFQDLLAAQDPEADLDASGVADYFDMARFLTLAQDCD